MTTICYLPINLQKNNDFRAILSFKRFLQQSIYVRLTEIAQRDSGLQELLRFLSAPEIPLTPILEAEQYIFRSAITFKLANHSSLPVDSLAAHLWTNLAQKNEQDDNQADLVMRIQIIDHNWLIFNCDYLSLQVWLAYLSQQFLQRSQLVPRQGITASPPAAYCQYAHARACSLLRLLDQSVFCSFSPVPSSSSKPLILPPSTRSLLEHLLRVTDYLTAEKTENWSKIAVNLSEAFLSFDKNFNLANHQVDTNAGLGDFKRLLILNTRFILQELLMTQLNLAAPEEL
ncbi:MAG: hypothetical protein VKJ02_05160 [Snowella sp.]|nr:hypothetical protein [Snowella sp.]